MPGEIQLLDRGFNLLATPNPAEWAFAAVVCGLEVRSDMKLAAGTTYRQAVDKLPMLERNRVTEGYGDFVYTGSSNAVAPAGHVALYFAEAGVANLAAEPYEEYEELKPHPWPPILVKLDFIPDRSMPISANGPNGDMVVGYRHYAREVFVPEHRGGSMVITRKFQGPVAFDIPDHEVPVPMAVTYDFAGAFGTFPECLHKRLRIRSQRTAFASYSAIAGSRTVSGGVSGQVYEATNFTTWEAYVRSDEQTYENGLWHRVQEEVLPPPLPRAITRLRR